MQRLCRAPSMVQRPFTIFVRADLNQAQKILNRLVTFVPI
jgi:hypothetical protein